MIVQALGEGPGPTLVVQHCWLEGTRELDYLDLLHRIPMQEWRRVISHPLRTRE